MLLEADKHTRKVHGIFPGVGSPPWPEATPTSRRCRHTKPDFANWRSRSGWDKALVELDLESVTPHDLCRTFGSLARSAGADLRWIQQAMGHESITTTARIYAHLYDDELDLVADALDRLGGGR